MIQDLKKSLPYIEEKRFLQISILNFLGLGLLTPSIIFVTSCYWAPFHKTRSLNFSEASRPPSKISPRNINLLEGGLESSLTLNVNKTSQILIHGLILKLLKNVGFWYWPNISANDPDPGSGSKGVDPVFLLFLQI